MDLQTAIASCRGVRSSFSKIFCLPSNFQFCQEDHSVLFLSATGGAGNSLYSVELSGAGEENKTWKKIICTTGGQRQLSRSEQLLRERMRASGSGITHYEYQSDGDRLLVQDGPNCRLLDRSKETVLVEFPEFPGAVDYKLCPHCPTLVACVHEGDLWVLTEGDKHQLTNTAANRKEKYLTAGQPPFIVQEEFDRYTGYWWQPTTGSGIYRIVYEEVDEGEVEEVHTFNPSTQDVEHYRYPRPGSRNTTSTLKLLEFQFSSSGTLAVTTRRLACKLSEWFPEGEYLTRVGWMPQGDSVWVQLLDRWQKHLQVFVLSVDAFLLHDLSPSEYPSPYLLWEDTSHHWINIGDIMHFLSAKEEEAPIRFIVASETTGFRHLYLIQATPPTPSRDKSPLVVPKATFTAQQLTAGKWVVFGSNLWVDEARGVVYFEGNAFSCLEKHLYAISLNGELPCAIPTQLTPPGFYHSTTVDPSCNVFASVYSSDSCAPSASVYSISPSLTAEWLCDVWKGTALPPDCVPPSHFSLTSESGEELHGVVYPPKGVQEGKQYPTVLYTYGGPAIQFVTRGLSRHLPRLQAWVQHGFAVVMIDNRGSANRGIQFEAYIKGHMGGVELSDQVAGLRQAAEHVGYLDLTRVAITGWSYGGYMALMGLAKYPEVFKVAIAGAPVTDWLAYDTGYTERYLGVPPVDLKAYQLSSVLSYVSTFPTELNRLLVVHGLNDENVFFTHTSLLIDRLVALGKPYQLQVYTGERHGLRSPSAALHCDATVLLFLVQHV